MYLTGSRSTGWKSVHKQQYLKSETLTLSISNGDKYLALESYNCATFKFCTDADRYNVAILDAQSARSIDASCLPTSRE